MKAFDFKLSKFSHYFSFFHIIVHDMLDVTFSNVFHSTSLNWSCLLVLKLSYLFLKLFLITLYFSMALMVDYFVVDCIESFYQSSSILFYFLTYFGKFIEAFKIRNVLLHELMNTVFNGMNYFLYLKTSFIF